MATEFKLPALGENIESGDVLKVLVSSGDSIEKEQTVLELETDKAAIEVPSPVSGTVREVHVKEGDKASVGQLILTVETDGAAKDAAPAEPPEAQPAAEAERPEAEAPSPKPQEEKASAVPGPPAAPPAPPSPISASDDGDRIPVPATPSVRRLAREIGVELRAVKGTGPAGRISSKDVKAHAKSVLQGGGPVPAGAPTVTGPLPDFSKWGKVERKPMTGVRRATAAHLSHAWTTIPHVTQCDKADITDLEKLRKRYGKKAETAGGKLTITAIILNLLASALKVFPQFNASVDAARNEVIYKQYIHIGVAVDTERGLLVPVIRDVDRKNIIRLSVELSEAAQKAREGKLSIDEMRGGSMTVTNLGGIGGTYFTPIINAPEVAILGVSRGSVEPVHVNGEFQPRLMLPLSLSYDHRLIDGADAARFLRWLAEALENPFLIPLEG